MDRDDSKALMKVCDIHYFPMLMQLTIMQVYLPVIKGLIPPLMVEAIWNLLDFTYLVHHNDFDTKTLNIISNALTWFHKHHEIFRTLGLWPTGFSLLCQHSLAHNCYNIEEFGALNGLCFSITGSCNKLAVKKLWHQ